MKVDEAVENETPRRLPNQVLVDIPGFLVDH